MPSNKSIHFFLLKNCNWDENFLAVLSKWFPNLISSSTSILLSSLTKWRLKNEWMNCHEWVTIDGWLKYLKNLFLKWKFVHSCFNFHFSLLFMFFLSVYIFYIYAITTSSTLKEGSRRKKTTKMKHFKIDFSSCWYLRNAFICQWFEHGSRKERHGKFWFFWKINHVKMWIKKLKYKIVVKKKDRTDLQIFLR